MLVIIGLYGVTRNKFDLDNLQVSLAQIFPRALSKHDTNFAFQKLTHFSFM